MKNYLSSRVFVLSFDRFKTLNGTQDAGKRTGVRTAQAYSALGENPGVRTRAPPPGHAEPGQADEAHTRTTHPNTSTQGQGPAPCSAHCAGLNANAQHGRRRGAHGHAHRTHTYTHAFARLMCHHRTPWAHSRLLVAGCCVLIVGRHCASHQRTSHSRPCGTALHAEHAPQSPSTGIAAPGA